MDIQSTPFLLAALSELDDYSDAVRGLVWRVAEQLAEATVEFEPRTAAEIKVLILKQLDHPPGSGIWALDPLGHDDLRLHHELLSGMADQQAETNYAIAVRFVARAAEHVKRFRCSVVAAHRRYRLAVAEGDSGEKEVSARLLCVLLQAEDQVRAAFASIFATCFSRLPLIHDYAYSIQRLLAELELYARDLPAVLARINLRVDREVIDQGIVAFLDESTGA